MTFANAQSPNHARSPLVSSATSAGLRLDVSRHCGRLCPQTHMVGRDHCSLALFPILNVEELNPPSITQNTSLCEREALVEPFYVFVNLRWASSEAHKFFLLEANLFLIHFNFSTSLILSPIQRITGTAIEFPKALYLGPSGQSSADLFLQGIAVKLSGKPCRRSHSIGVKRRTQDLIDIAGPCVVSKVCVIFSCIPHPLLDVFAVFTE